MSLRPRIKNLEQEIEELQRQVAELQRHQYPRFPNPSVPQSPWYPYIQPSVDWRLQVLST